MEKITDSKFGKFEGSEIINPQSIVGGGDTGAGERCLPDGRCMAYTGDYSSDTGTNYWGTSYRKAEC